MHLLIPFASGLSPAAGEAIRRLELPHLADLLRHLEVRLEPGPIPAADSFSPPHERALARALGWEGPDGQLPLAAWRARADGIDPVDLAWGEVTPTHWQAGRDQVLLLDPAALALQDDEATARSVFEAVRPLFVEDGYELVWGRPDRWYLAHPHLGTLRTASIDRAIGRNLHAFLPYDAAARPIRRLQQEVQMLLYQHPQHDARTARGQLPVNSFWLSGCGREQPPRGPAPQIHDGLRASALHADWAAWSKAWQALDRDTIQAAASAHRRGETVRITLCGERRCADLQSPTSGWWTRLRRRFDATAPTALLADL